jgi:hypothetical protein
MGAPDIDQLQSICEEFPYAGLFSLAYLEALHRTEDIRLAQAIPKHAFRISNRIKLYTLLHQAQVNTSPVVDDTEKKEDSTTAPASNHITPVLEKFTENTDLNHADKKEDLSQASEQNPAVPVQEELPETPELPELPLTPLLPAVPLDPKITICPALFCAFSTPFWEYKLTYPKSGAGGFEGFSPNCISPAPSILNLPVGIINFHYFVIESN